jgi:hypothetical protein
MVHEKTFVNSGNNALLDRYSALSLIKDVRNRMNQPQLEKNQNQTKTFVYLLSNSTVKPNISFHTPTLRERFVYRRYWYKTVRHKDIFRPTEALSEVMFYYYKLRT